MALWDPDRQQFRGFEDWEEWFRASERRFRRTLEERDTVRVLRNQIVHGGVTWNSQVNRDQVRGGAASLAFLMPVFVDGMMDNPHGDRGRPFYSVVEQGCAGEEELQGLIADSGANWTPIPERSGQKLWCGPTTTALHPRQLG